MEGLELFDKLLNERIMFGNVLKLKEDLSIIPVYKLKITTMNLNAEIKSQSGDGTGGGIVVTPVCVLKIYDNDISVIRLDEKSNKDEMFEFLPNILGNLNINDIIKNIKI